MFPSLGADIGEQRLKILLEKQEKVESTGTLRGTPQMLKKRKDLVEKMEKKFGNLLMLKMAMV